MASPTPVPPTSPASGLRRRLASKKASDDARINTIISSASAAAPPALASYLAHAGPALDSLVKVVAMIGPFYAKGAEICVHLYRSLPIDVVEMLMGLGMCFCGGTYCASIAAIEAFMLVGWDGTSAALADIYDNVLAIKDATERDEKNTKRSDRAELTAADQLKHKLKVAALAVPDPDKLMHAVGGLYAGWVVVQGTLRFQESLSRVRSASADTTSMRVLYACALLCMLLRPCGRSSHGRSLWVSPSQRCSIRWSCVTGCRSLST